MMTSACQPQEQPAKGVESMPGPLGQWILGGLPDFRPGVAPAILNPSARSADAAMRLPAQPGRRPPPPPPAQPRRSEPHRISGTRALRTKPNNRLIRGAPAGKLWPDPGLSPGHNDKDASCRMSRDDDTRRRMSNAYLDRRRDRLDLMRSQQRRTRAVYEGLRDGDDLKVRAALGVPPANASADSVGLGSIGMRTAYQEMERRKEGVLHEIAALTRYSDEHRRELRLRFELIDLCRRGADDELLAFDKLVRIRGAELTEIANRLRSEIDSIDAAGSPAASLRLPVAHPARLDPTPFLPLWLGTGLTGIAQRIGLLPHLSEATRQDWVAELRRIDRLKTRPRSLLAAALWPARPPELAQAAAKLHAEIESTGRCVGLLAGISLMRGACRRYLGNL